MTDAINWAEYPRIRKVGRYAFFVPCAFGCGIVVSLPFVELGMARDMAHNLVNVASIAAFLALREMSKAWDRALIAEASAIEARSDATPKSDAAEGESATRQGDAQ